MRLTWTTAPQIKRWIHWVMAVVFTTLGCTEKNRPAQAPVAVAPPPSVERAIAPVAVELVPELGAARIPLERELLGVSAALLELSLADLPEVIPRIQGLPPAPSLADAFDLIAERWTATLRLARATDGSTRLEARLCDSAQACTELSEVLFADDPSSAAARVAAGIAAGLGRPPSAEMLARWVRPVSPDRYGTIVCGRGAAKMVGLSPPVPQELWGDRRADPLTRAIWIDPDLSLCHWLIARRAAAFELSTVARAAMERAVAIDKGRLVFWMDRAALYASREGRRLALGSWETAGVRAHETRFRIGRARTLLGMGDAREASNELRGLPAAWSDALSAVLLRIQVASAGVAGENLDALLARWQQLSPLDPEPVRRRIALRIRESRHLEALELVKALRRVDHSGQASELAIALAVAARRLDDAATRARDAGSQELAALLDARRHLEADPLRMPSALKSAKGPGAALARARLHLQAGRIDQALREAETVQSGALLPDALALRVQALGAAHRNSEAARVLESLRRYDPALAARFGAPGSASGSVGADVHVRVTPP
jgi:hypothetical protein